MEMKMFVITKFLFIIFFVFGENVKVKSWQILTTMSKSSEYVNGKILEITFCYV